MFEDKVEDAQKEGREDQVHAVIDNGNSEEMKKVEVPAKEDSKVAGDDDQPAQINTQPSLGGEHMVAELAEEITTEKKIGIVPCL